VCRRADADEEEAGRKANADGIQGAEQYLAIHLPTRHICVNTSGKHKIIFGSTRRCSVTKKIECVSKKQTRRPPEPLPRSSVTQSKVNRGFLHGFRRDASAGRENSIVPLSPLQQLENLNFAAEFFIHCIAQYTTCSYNISRIFRLKNGPENMHLCWVFNSHVTREILGPRP